MVREGYKQTEIGVIPEEWEVSKISQVSKITTGNKNTQDRVGDGAYPFFVRSQIVERINSYSFDGEAILTAGDGVGVGKVFHYIQGRFDFHQRVYSISNFDSNVFGFYFFKYFQNNFYNRIMQMTAKSSVDSVRMETISEMLIPLPPLKEQEAIAEALSDTDVWIDSLEQLIAKKRLIKQGAMQELLTPKEAWEVKKLGEVIDVYRGGSPRPIQEYITDKSTGINWIKIGDTSATGKYIVSANEKIITEGEKRSRKVFVGDFLLSNSMSFGRPYILKIEGCIHDGWLVLQNYQNSFETEYLYYLLTSKYIIDQYKSKAAGSSVLNLNKELVSSVDLLIPSLKEQEHIATILSDMDREIEQLEDQLAKAKQIKQGMMQELLTGRVRLV